MSAVAVETAINAAIVCWRRWRRHQWLWAGVRGVIGGGRHRGGSADTAVASVAQVVAHMCALAPLEAQAAVNTPP